jgi:ABC-2 type transport system permease protein
VRAVGDLNQSAGLGWLSWMSPLGWVRLTRAFAGEQWWVFGLDFALTAALLAAAYVLCARRDLGAGLIPARPGPATASPALNSPLALAWRLYRGTLTGWGAGIAGFGFLLGLVGYNMSGFVDALQMREWAARMGSYNVGDSFLFVTMYILGQVISITAIAAVLQMRSEEREGRAEALLSLPVPRLRWALSHLFFAMLAPAILLLVMGLAVGLGYGLSAGDVAGELPRLLARTMSGLPAIWVVAGIAALFYGLLPRLAAPVTWSILAVFLALELGWELQMISQAVFNISPYAYVHWTIQPTASSLIVLTLVGAALTPAGLAGLRRRDIG